MIIYLSPYIQNTLGYSPVQAGLRFLPLSLASFTVALLTGGLIGKVAMRVLLGVAMAAAAAGLASMAHLTATSSWLVLLPGLILAGIGLGITSTGLSSAALAAVEPARAGMASGLVTRLSGAAREFLADVSRRGEHPGGACRKNRRSVLRGAESDYGRLPHRSGDSGPVPTSRRWRTAWLSIIFAAIPAVIYLAAGLPVIAETVSIGTLIAFTTLQNSLFRPITGLLSTSVSLISSLALFARIFGYLDLPVEVDAAGPAFAPGRHPGTPQSATASVSPAAER